MDPVTGASRFIVLPLLCFVDTALLQIEGL